MNPDRKSDRRLSELNIKHNNNTDNILQQDFKNTRRHYSDKYAFEKYPKIDNMKKEEYIDNQIGDNFISG
jgi:hypothetical protein